MSSVRVGAVEVIPVQDGAIARPPAQFFPETPASAGEPYRHYLVEHGDVPLNIGSFLLRADGRTLLVDTGLGPRVDVGGGPRLLDALHDAGVAPEDVDAVLTTHMHFD